MKKIILPVLVFLSAFCNAQYLTQIGNTTVQIDTVYTALDIPWEIIYGPDNHIWTTERRGIVSRINPITKTKTVILNLSSSIFQQSEAGLLGMILHPDFANTPEVFMAYTYGTFGSVSERIVKYTYNGTSLVNPTTLIDGITGNTTHIGARFEFLPDTTLLVSTGDAQNTSLPQNLNSLSGKILRLNTNGSIPANNPFANSYIYSYGHRNVQGMHRAPNGNIYITEHGASTDDEFQILEAGRNYGWPNVEGFCNLAVEQTFCNANNVKEPLVAWTPTIAPSDLIWYENPDIPELDGKLIMTVLKDKRIIAFEMSANGSTVVNQTHYLASPVLERFRDICIGPNKEIYLATNGNSWSNTNPNTHSILRITVPNTSGIKQYKTSAIKVFPNPFLDKLQVLIPQNYIGARFVIHDILGRPVKDERIKNMNETFELGHLEKGVYEFSVIIDGNIVSSQKIVK